MLFKELEINVVIDVGARHGEYGVWLRRNGYDGWIFSFEPVGESFAALSRRSANDERWVVHPVALGREAKQADINVAEGTVLSSFLTPNAYAFETFGSGSKITATESVRINTLDEVFEGLLDGVEVPRVYLKLDTQGWDLEVLQGANRCLPRICALQTEISAQPLYEGMPTMSESLAYLDAIGFEVSAMFAIIHDQKLRAVEFDCVAVRTSAAV